MRTISIANYSFTPPRIRGRVELDDHGHVTLADCEPGLQRHLERGVLDWSTKPATRLTPRDGAKFFETVLQEFSGSYVRATETTAGHG